MDMIAIADEMFDLANFGGRPPAMWLQGAVKPISRQVSGKEGERISVTPEFSVMEQHLVAPRVVSPAGKLVFSRLKPGSSMIGARARR
jgi:hypothetical protein